MILILAVALQMETESLLGVCPNASKIVTVAFAFVVIAISALSITAIALSSKAINTTATTNNNEKQSVCNYGGMVHRCLRGD